MRFLISLLTCLLFSVGAFADVLVLNLSTTNVTTSAYLQLTASTATSASKLVICDTSGKFIKVAVGAVGKEHDLVGGGFDPLVSACIVIPSYVKAGSRISLKAIDGNATSGYYILSLVE